MYFFIYTLCAFKNKMNKSINKIRFLYVHGNNRYKNGKVKKGRYENYANSFLASMNNL